MSARGATTTSGGKKKAKKERSGWRKYLRWGLLGLLALFVVGLLVFLWYWFTTPIPEPNDFATSETTVVVYADGEDELGRYGTENRVSVPLDEVPEHVQYAVLAAEDRNFYNNIGISFVGMARAFWNNLTTDTVQGGSTITQQLVKNYYLTQDQTWDRKIKEIVLALKVDLVLTKDEILELYLNTIYYGRGAYGIQTGSQAYFREDVSDATVEQGAVLASVINAPSALDPAGGPENVAALEERFNFVLDGMVEEGWLAESERAGMTLPEFSNPPDNQAASGPNGHVMQTVLDELIELGYTEDEIVGSGLTIVSTIDEQAQDAAITAATDGFPPPPNDEVHVGLASVRPGTGEIVALYGGPDYTERQFNNATQALIQGGSTFKAFALAGGFEQGVVLSDYFAGNSPFTEVSPPVNNFGNASYGEYVDLYFATRKSVNSAFTDLPLQIGPQAVVDAAVRAGLDEDQPGLEANARVALGTASVSPLDMAETFATFAGRGVQAEPYIVESIETRDGTVEYSATPETTEAFDPDIIADVTFALQDVVNRGTATSALALGRPAAGKTGTASLTEGNTTSAYFAGYTPQLAAAVGFFRGDGTGVLDGVGGGGDFQGGSYPTSIWTTFMSLALEGEPVEYFPPPNIGYQPKSAPNASPSPSPSRDASPSREPGRPSEDPDETEEPPNSPDATDGPGPDPDPSDDPGPGGNIAPTDTPQATDAATSTADATPDGE